MTVSDQQNHSHADSVAYVSHHAKVLAQLGITRFIGKDTSVYDESTLVAELQQVKQGSAGVVSTASHAEEESSAVLTQEHNNTSQAVVSTNTQDKVAEETSDESANSNALAKLNEEKSPSITNNENSRHNLESVQTEQLIQNEYESTEQQLENEVIHTATSDEVSTELIKTSTKAVTPNNTPFPAFTIYAMTFKQCLLVIDNEVVNNNNPEWQLLWQNISEAMARELNETAIPLTHFSFPLLNDNQLTPDYQTTDSASGALTGWLYELAQNKSVSLALLTAQAQSTNSVTDLLSNHVQVQLAHLLADESFHLQKLPSLSAMLADWSFKKTFWQSIN